MTVLGFHSERTADGFVSEVYCFEHGKNLSWLHFQPIWSDDFKGLGYDATCDRCGRPLAATNSEDVAPPDGTVRIVVPIDTVSASLARLLLDHPRHRVHSVKQREHEGVVHVHLIGPS